MESGQVRYHFSLQWSSWAFCGVPNLVHVVTIVVLLFLLRAQQSGVGEADRAALVHKAAEGGGNC